MAIPMAACPTYRGITASLRRCLWRRTPDPGLGEPLTLPVRVGTVGRCRAGPPCHWPAVHASGQAGVRGHTRQEHRR